MTDKLVFMCTSAVSEQRYRIIGCPTLTSYIPSHVFRRTPGFLRVVNYKRNCLLPIVYILKVKQLSNTIQLECVPE